MCCNGLADQHQASWLMCMRSSLSTWQHVHSEHKQLLLQFSHWLQIHSGALAIEWQVFATLLVCSKLST